MAPLATRLTGLVIPITMPPLLAQDGDPAWLAVLFAITVQTGFLVPPSGFAVCFLRSVAPPEVATADIYRGMLPIIAIQVAVLALVWAWPQIATRLLA
jgi:TRAP-type mannitol/chloroaromatic compound transport system permease large subunit